MRKLYKIIVHDKAFKFPIYAELVRHNPSNDKYGYDSSVFKELLTGMKLYRGYTHPLLNGDFKNQIYFYPYTHPNIIVKKAEDIIGEVNGLYFDEYSTKSEISEVSPKEVKEFYASLNAGINLRNNITEYLQMFDNALLLQQEEVEKIYKKTIENERAAFLYRIIHEDEQTDDISLINKFTNRE